MGREMYCGISLDKFFVVQSSADVTGMIGTVVLLLAALMVGEARDLEFSGRLSLQLLNKMMSTSLHMELAGSESSFERLLDFEWDSFFAAPLGTPSPFIVCSEPRRENARRLRRLAGGDSNVETLYHRQGEKLCALVTLDHQRVSQVAEDGAFTLEPVPHLAKLSSSVVIESNKAVDNVREKEQPAVASPAGQEGVGEITGGDRRLQEDIDPGYTPGVSNIPAARDLLERSRRGSVVAVEVILTPSKRSRAEADALAALWKAQMDDLAHVASYLRHYHFWGAGDGQTGNRRIDGSRGGGWHRRRRRLKTRGLDGVETAEVVEGEESEAGGELVDDTDRDHEDRRRQGWATLASALDSQGDRGRGSSRDLGLGGGGAATGGTTSCGFESLRHTPSPDGQKIVLYGPHKVGVDAEPAGAGSWGGGWDEAERGGDALSAEICLSAMLSFLSLKPEVAHITSRSRSATMNFDAAWVVQSGIEDFTPLWDESLRGQDEIIGVADTGVDLNHCDFRELDGDSVTPTDWDDSEEEQTDLTKRKVVQYIKFVDDFDEDNGHGTHVAGTLAGANLLGTGDDTNGIALDGKLAVFDFGDSDGGNALDTPEQVDDIMLQPAYNGGARIHSNSWDTLNVGYTTLSREVDRFVFTYPEFLVIVAAGNCGDILDSDFDCDGIGPTESVLSPAQAKNVIAVGAAQSGGSMTRDMDTVSYFSSKGPTPDGRIKPDIVAPGDPLVSASADTSGDTCAYSTRQGTSMSTPVVAGSAALVRQYFREGWYNTGSKNETLGFEPSAALIKAVLVNSAVGMQLQGVNPASGGIDITLTAPPDNTQGHGRVTLNQGLNVNSSVGLFFKDWETIGEDETLEYEVSLHEDADLEKNLRVSLVWTDPYGVASASRALLHDLDLTVASESDGAMYYPNGLSGKDPDNNVEKVTITTSVPEEVYKIRVTSGSLSETDVQYFALVANGEFIKTNAPPDPPEPDDWLDFLSDGAAAIDISWEMAAGIGIAVAMCCALTCACQRSSHRSGRAHKPNARHAGGPGRGPAQSQGHHRGRPQGVRAVTLRGVIQDQTPHRRPDVQSLEVITGTASRQPGRPAPGPRDRPNQPMGHPQRGPGGLGQGQRDGHTVATLPMEVRSSDQTASPSPRRGEACPECRARFHNPVALVDHVESKHGGAAIPSSRAGEERWSPVQTSAMRVHSGPRDEGDSSRNRGRNRDSGRDGGRGRDRDRVGGEGSSAHVNERVSPVQYSWRGGGQGHGREPRGRSMGPAGNGRDMPQMAVLPSRSQSPTRGARSSYEHHYENNPLPTAPPPPDAPIVVAQPSYHVCLAQPQPQGQPWQQSQQQQQQQQQQQPRGHLSQQRDHRADRVARARENSSEGRRRGQPPGRIEDVPLPVGNVVQPMVYAVPAVEVEVVGRQATAPPKSRSQSRGGSRDPG